LSPMIRIAIGWMCETLRREHAEQIALDRFNKEDQRQKARDARSRLNSENARRIASVERMCARDASPLSIEMARVELERWQVIALAKFSKEVSPILEKHGRSIALENYRPRAMTRAQVYKQVAAECEKLGWGAIAVHQIRDCWRDHDPEQTET
jgi:hypothetical protein